MIQQYKKHILLGLVAVLALSIPLTVGMLQRQQENRSRAQASTTLSLVQAGTTTSSISQKKIGDIISLDLMVTPGTNLVTFVKFELKYDETKLQPISPDPFTLNTSAFITKDGPIITPGTLLASASVGSDPTKAIQKPTRVGTIQFKAVGNTGSTPTTITFSNLTQALSSAANDQASENVVSTTSPANIQIGGTQLQACVSKKFTAELTGGQEIPTTTSTASATFILEMLQEAGKANSTTTIKNLRLNTVTGIFIYSPASASAKGNPRVTIFSSQSGSLQSPHVFNDFFIPEDVRTDIDSGSAYVGISTQQNPNGEIRGKLTCQTAAPSGPVPTGSNTPLTFELLLHGVGAAGDNPNPRGNDLSNKNPLHPQRNLIVEIFDTNNQLVTSISGALSLNYDDASGSFIGQLDAAGVPEGSYNLKVKSDRYLRKRIPGIVQIKPNQENAVPAVDLVAGDTNSDNVLNVVDYNAFLDCGYGEIEPLPMLDPNSVFKTKECQAHTPPELVDIDDNGTINSFDYNLFLRELSVQNGD